MTPKPTYFLFDTETGGLDAKQHSLLTLYGMILDQRLNVLDEIDLKIKPNNDAGYVVQIAALNVNKIDLYKHDAEAIQESEAAQKLEAFLKRHTLNLGGSKPIKLIPMGHNSESLDIPMVKELLPTFNEYVGRRVLDTAAIGLFFQLCGHIPASSIGSLYQLCSFFKIDTSGHHDAKSDCYMTLTLLKRFKKVFDLMYSWYEHSGEEPLPPNEGADND